MQVSFLDLDTAGQVHVDRRLWECLPDEIEILQRGPLLALLNGFLERRESGISHFRIEQLVPVAVVLNLKPRQAGLVAADAGGKPGGKAGIVAGLESGDETVGFGFVVKHFGCSLFYGCMV